MKGYIERISKSEQGFQVSLFIPNEIYENCMPNKEKAGISREELHENIQNRIKENEEQKRVLHLHVGEVSLIQSKDI